MHYVLTNCSYKVSAVPYKIHISMYKMDMTLPTHTMVWCLKCNTHGTQQYLLCSFAESSVMPLCKFKIYNTGINSLKIAVVIIIVISKVVFDGFACTTTSSRCDGLNAKIHIFFIVTISRLLLQVCRYKLLTLPWI